MDNNGIINDIDKPETPDYGKGSVGEAEGRFVERREEIIERYDTTEVTMSSDKKNLILGLVGGVISTFIIAGCVFSFLYFLNADKREALKTSDSDSSYTEENEDEADDENSKDKKEETTTKKAEKTTAESTTESTTKATTTTTETTTEKEENRQEDYYRPDSYRETQPTEPYYAVSRSKMYSDDYILPSDIRYLTTSDLDKFSYYEMDYVTNEIYARHGYIFQTEKFADYFEARSWYTPSNRSMSDVENKFSTIERANIEFIVAYEKAKGWRESSPTVTKPQNTTRYQTTTEQTYVYTTTESVPRGAVVPDVVGLDSAEAKRILENNGLKVDIMEAYSSEKEGTVIRQSKSAGTEVPSGMTIVIDVSIGEEKEKTPTEAYVEFLSEHIGVGNTSVYCAIADVNGDSDPELLIENWNGALYVYTYNKDNDSLIELTKKQLGKGYTMQMYYDSSSCQVIFPTRNTGGVSYDVLRFEGRSSYSVETLGYVNAKHSEDGNVHYYKNGVDITAEEYEVAEKTLADGYTGVDYTISSIIQQYS